MQRLLLVLQSSLLQNLWDPSAEVSLHSRHFQAPRWMPGVALSEEHFNLFFREVSAGVQSLAGDAGTMFDVPTL